MLVKIGLVVLVALIFFLGYIALRDPEYIITRQIAIHAPPARIFPFLNNSKLSERWGPWAEVDPTTKMNYSGPEAGVGSKTYWAGGKKLGSGSATIVNSIPDKEVDIQLAYTSPMNMTQDSAYIIQSSGKDSVVTWRVKGRNTFPGRVMCAFVDMDKQVGGFFEKGLSNLKTLVEQNN
jgi:hypothetical protein